MCRNAHLFIYSSERAWAHAMHMKSLITDDPESASRSIKDHIKSRLQKAHRHASQLRDLFSDLASKATDVDIVEATAYASSLAGAVAFEKAHWEDALREFAIARTSYDTLSFAVKSDIYKEFLTSTVDPSLRYAAYQLEIPRSVDTTGLAKQFFPQQDQALIETLKGLNPKVLGGGDATEVEDGETAIVISSVNWRGRVAAIDEADIAVALGNAQKAETSLQAYMSGNPNQDQAAAFDELLQAWQDSVDATKREIDRATADGVSTTDPKLQKLQLVFTYVNYNLISRRIGRNRVMVDAISRTNTKTEKKVNSLKELVVLYDAILQVSACMHRDPIYTHTDNL